MAKGKEILRGTSIMAGTITAKVRIINGDESRLAQVQPGELLVTSHLEPSPQTPGMSTAEYNSYLAKAGGILQNTGGPTSHAAIKAKEYLKPCVTGTTSHGIEATRALKDGEYYVLEGHVGYTTNAYGRQVPYGALYEFVPDEPGSKIEIQPVAPPPMLPSVAPVGNPAAGGDTASKTAEILARFRERALKEKLARDKG